MGCRVHGDRALERRLAAILAADVVGYSSLMEADAAGTLAALNDVRSAIFRPNLEARQGTVIKRMGDGWIVEFANVADAVACAVDIQEAIADHQTIRLRVGIHLGDVAFQEDDIFGDGINVASRLEALAAPGQVLISDLVHHSLDRKTASRFSGGEAMELKNISRPVQVWRWPKEAQKDAIDGAAASIAEPATPEKPSVAVLPFNSMSRESEHAYFADGIAEDIITALSKVSKMRVIARNSTLEYKGKAHDLRQIAGELGVRYLLEGSVRSGGARLRITAQLTDAHDGGHIWAERYDRTVEDIFDIQDEITKEIVTALRVKLTDGEAALLPSRGTDDIEAWQLCVRAMEQFQRFDAVGYSEARNLAQRAIESDPNYGCAWAVLGFSYWWEGRLGYGDDPATQFNIADEYADRAVTLDHSAPWVIGLKSMASGSLGRSTESLEAAQRGYRLNPGSADIRAFLAYALIRVGEHQSGVEHLRAAIELNPFCPSWYRGGLARGLVLLGELEEAVSATEDVISAQNASLFARIVRTYALGRMGRLEEARETLADLSRLAPELRLEHVPGMLLIDSAADTEKIVEGLREVGFPA